MKKNVATWNCWHLGSFECRHS